MDSRVVAHLVKLHEEVNLLDEPFPSTKEHLVIDIWTIDKLCDCIEQKWDKLVGSKIGKNKLPESLNDIYELGDCFVNEIDGGYFTLFVVFEVFPVVFYLVAEIELRLTEAAFTH